jgi:hypothetical protein
MAEYETQLDAWRKSETYRRAIAAGMTEEQAFDLCDQQENPPALPPACYFEQEPVSAAELEERRAFAAWQRER